MSEHYDFHYQPTGSGAISGQQVLQQTEDAINELGDYVNDNVGGAMDVAQQALETAQNAEQDAQTALDTANSFSSAIQSAQQDASTALSTAQTAQTTASNANNTAIQAQQDANTAVTTANNASGQVSTLSGTVTTLGQRVTTAEGNIGQNTNDITALTTRVGTAEGNITTLQNDVSIAQGNASSAMATAGTVKQQAYVLRYSSTAITDNSTIAFSTLDNTDNIKSGDKILDVDGKLFEITAVDTTNETVTVSSALIDLAQDSNVVHKSGNETISGDKTFANSKVIVGRNTNIVSVVQFVNADVVGGSTNGTSGFEVYGSSVSDANKIGGVTVGEYSNNAGSYALIECNRTVSGVKSSNIIRSLIRTDGSKELSAIVDNDCKLGSAFLRWSKIYGTKYYYGSNNVEFSTKFVTTDTAQAISGSKTFSEDVVIGNSDTTQSSKRLVLRSYKASLSGSNSDNWGINFNAGASYAVAINAHKSTDGAQGLTYTVRTQDSNNNIFTSSYRFRVFIDGNSVLEPDVDNNVSLGRSTNRWKDCQTYLVNGVEPSSLGMPDLDNGIDISSYLDTSQSSTNYYTPPANGWISISINTPIRDSIQIECGGGFRSGVLSCMDPDNSNNYIASIIVPCIKNDTVTIYFKSSQGGTIKYAKFFPCQGNV